jgi:hypothetical protein
MSAALSAMEWALPMSQLFEAISDTQRLRELPIL